MLMAEQCASRRCIGDLLLERGPCLVKFSGRAFGMTVHLVDVLINASAESAVSINLKFKCGEHSVVCDLPYLRI